MSRPCRPGSAYPKQCAAAASLSEAFLLPLRLLYYIENPDQLPEDLRQMVPEFGLEEMVKDHIAGMTDQYSMHKYEELFVPKAWAVY